MVVLFRTQISLAFGQKEGPFPNILLLGSLILAEVLTYSAERKLAEEMAREENLASHGNESITFGSWESLEKAGRTD